MENQSVNRKSDPEGHGGREPPWKLNVQGVIIESLHPKIVVRDAIKLAGFDPDVGWIIILKVAGERQVLGLSSVVTGQPSPIEATTIEFCQIKFVDRESFLQLLDRNTNAALSCARLVSQEIGTTFRDVHELLLARSSTEKLARLLLSWVAKESHNLEVRVAANFTHEEIAQMIGSSRETVTRLLSDLKRRELIRLEGSTLVISNRIALQAIAS